MRTSTRTELDNELTLGSELSTLLQEGAREEADEADAAAVRALAAPPPAEMDVAQRVVARWRAFMAERKACRCSTCTRPCPTSSSRRCCGG